MMLFLRLLPFAVGLMQALTFWIQLEQPLRYPWIVLAGFVCLPATAFGLAWRRISLIDVLKKMTPSFLLLATLAFALLLAEGTMARTLLIVLAAAVSCISLEFLFLLAYQPMRYPVNGLSRLNLAYVPLTVWYLAATSAGLLAFVHADRVMLVLVFVAMSALLFYTTGHPGANMQQHLSWIVVGAIVGLHVGLLAIFLPINMAAQGMMAALLISGALRVRRYVHAPFLSRRQAWIEGGAACAALTLIMSTAKWM